MGFGLSWLPDQGNYLCLDLCKFIGRCLAFVQCFARHLVQAFGLIGRCGARTFHGTHHLKRTALDLGGHQAVCKRPALAL